MTDPYVPYGQQPAHPPAGVPSQKPGAVKLAALAVLALTLIFAGGVMVSVLLMDQTAMEQSIPPDQLAEMEAEGLGMDQIRLFFLGCAGLIGLIALGIGVLLAAFTWANKAWAMVTAIVLAGLLFLLSGFGMIFNIIATVSPSDAMPAPTALAIIQNVVMTLLSLATIISLAIALKRRSNMSTSPNDAVYQAAWQSYYAQQQQPGQMPPADPNQPNPPRP